MTSGKKREFGRPEKRHSERDGSSDKRQGGSKVAGKKFGKQKFAWTKFAGNKQGGKSFRGR
jgi:hypothetical protein